MVLLNQLTSYLSPKLEVKIHPTKGGLGVFARESVQTGELLAVFGGCLLSNGELEKLPASFRQLSLQVEDGQYLLSIQAEPPDRVNHSCNPNAGFRGEKTLVAMRNITFREEVCFDYAMSDGSSYDEFECVCGASNCRGRVTGNDWCRPDLWEQYAGYFSPYLQRRIDKLKMGSYPRGLVNTPQAHLRAIANC
jgi:hypothetical protein